MNLAIQGSFEAYVWAALWQVTLGGLQLGGPPFNPPKAENWVGRFQLATSLVGGAVSWMAWGLSVWVGTREGIAAGILFGAFSFATNSLTLVELYRLKPDISSVQVLSLAAMPVFAYQTLSALGILA